MKANSYLSKILPNRLRSEKFKRRKNFHDLERNYEFPFLTLIRSKILDKNLLLGKFKKKFEIDKKITDKN